MLAALAVLAGLPGPAAAPVPAVVTAPAATAEMTTADGSSRFAPLAVTPTVAGDTEAQVRITVRPEERNQSMVGFGASMTESSASVLRSLPGGDRAMLMSELFAPAGLHLSVLRQPIGGSEFVAGSHYTLADTDGTADPDLRRFSIRRDQVSVLPLVRKAADLSGSMTVIASPWSAPAWMKSNGSLIGGSLRATPQIESAYARYLARFVAAYQAQGVPVDYLTVQNEPQHRTPDYPGMVMDPDQQGRVVAMLSAVLAANGADTRILGWDHNWSGGEQYLDRLLAGPAAQELAGLAFHCYEGSPAAMTQLAPATEHGVFLTECSGSYSQGDRPAKVFADTLDWQARTLLLGALKAGSRTLITWNLALDPEGGPRLGGCSTCTGVVTIDPATGQVTRNAEYYVLGHLSRHVAPGAVRIGTSGAAGGVDAVAFANPDGSTALVLYSAVRSDRTLVVEHAGSSYQLTVPGRALVSVDWPAG